MTVKLSYLTLIVHMDQIRFLKKKVPIRSAHLRSLLVKFLQGYFFVRTCRYLRRKILLSTSGIKFFVEQSKISWFNHAREVSGNGEGKSIEWASLAGDICSPRKGASVLFYIVCCNIFYQTSLIIIRIG